MSAKIFHKLASVNDVFNILSKFLRLEPWGVIEIPIEEAAGYVLAEDVVAPHDSPPYDRSEVDGYAVCSTSIEGADEDSPAKLSVKGYVRIGEVPVSEVGCGEAVEIDTGALIPRGADAVVMVECTKRVGDTLYVFKSAGPGENIAFTGSDVIAGEMLLHRGTLLTSREVAALAAVGIGKIRVFRKPVIGVISIGSELIPPGRKLHIPKVFDVNQYSIASRLRELGIKVRTYGIIPDNEDLVKRAIAKALEECDAVITTGGTSAGITDVTYRSVSSLGTPGILIHGIKVKPGKPTFFAVVGGKLVIGLPGFPLSSRVVLEILVIPILRRVMGLGSQSVLKTVKARLALRVSGSRGFERVVPVALIKKGEDILAYPVFTRSGSISVLTYADGFIRVPEDVWVLEENSLVDVYPLSEHLTLPNLVVIGSHDYLLEALIHKAARDCHKKILSVGSLTGLLSVGRGEADIAGTHLLDEQTMEYNTPYIKRLGLANKVVLVRGYYREVGLIIPKGNPKGIKGLEDLLRGDVFFINRTRGSGTRTLVDLKLKELARKIGVPFSSLVKRIKGYTLEARTHTGVAAAISQGRADVGVGIKHAAKLYNLDFILLTREVFDIAINRDSLKNRCVAKVLSALRGDALEELLRVFSGYVKHEKTGDVVLSEH